jgi:hypothetical protein
MDIEEAVLGAVDKLEALESINVEALRAGVRALQAAYLDTGRSALLKIAHNLKIEIRKLEAVK